jgi:hypothetical protein
LKQKPLDSSEEEGEEEEKKKKDRRQERSQICCGTGYGRANCCTWERSLRSAHLEAVGDANKRKHGREEADPENGEKDEAV